MEERTLADFRPYLHQEFSVRLENGDDYQLELLDLKDLGEPPGPGFRRPFVLSLCNPDRSVYLPQGTYQLHHAQLGFLDLFIVPVGPGASGMNYEVTFG